MRKLFSPALTILSLGIWAAASAWTQPALVPMTIKVRVPTNTPVGDTVWIWGGLLFDTNWHVQMTPLAGTPDTWQASISAPAGTIVRYFYNRNNNWNTQEMYVPFGASQVNYRELVMANGATVSETVAQWIDTPPVNNSTGTVAGTVTDQAGNPLMGIRVSAGPHQKITFSDGSFLIEGVPAGPNTITFCSDNGEYGATTVATTISPAGTTTKNVALAAVAMSTVTFNITIPGNTPAGAVPRLFGDTYRLGMVERSMAAVADTTRMIDMARVAGNLWTYTVQLGNGTCVNYLYTLGYYRLNYERDANGNKLPRSLCVNGSTTVNDTVAAWKSPQQVPVSLSVVSPTGDEDAIYVDVLSNDGVGPVKMWAIGPGRAAYTIYADPSTTLNYLYIRNGDPQIGMEIVGTDKNPPAYRTIATGAGGSAANDTITVWRHQMRETALSTVTTGITRPVLSRPAGSPFQTGVELMDYWRPAWLPLVAPTVARIKSTNAQWVQIASVWSPVGVDNPTFEPVNISFPRQDLVAHIRAAKSAGLKVTLTFEPYPNVFHGPNSTAWYDQFFGQIQSAALYHAKIAQQEGVEMFMLGSLYFGVDDDGLSSTYINAKWKGMIAAIRASGYTGQITSQVLRNTPAYDWYGALDYLGDDWWWPIAATASDTVQSMYDTVIAKLTSYYLPIENRFKKPFIFSAVAYYSADTSAMQFYNWDAPQFDPNLPADPSVPSSYDQQARAFQAVLLAFAATPWVQGCYPFGYEYFNLDSKNQSTRDKTAENIMSQIYQQINANPPSTSPLIMSVNTAGGFPDISQNGWIEIKGTNLAPASVGPNGMTWSNAPEFASGTMPTRLNGVSVTVNDKPAFVYYISRAQVNVLSPLDSTVGPVQIVVTNGGTSSVPYNLNMVANAPSFLLLAAGEYVVATHADYSLVGPASLSVPGYPFTPARPGETIVLYGVGFGPPKTALVNGSSSQSGLLPSLPVIQIGGAPATVTFAGLISPGLYQINVIVPNAVPNGDNPLTCSYNGQTTPAGDLITVQK